MNDTTKSMHSPGPWEATSSGVFDNNGDWVCASPYVDARWKANSQLIASAPRMLTALQKMVRYHTPGEWIDTSGSAYKELNEARAAIAEALGTDGVQSTN